MQSSFKKLPQSFFQRPATEVARALIGKILVREPLRAGSSVLSAFMPKLLRFGSTEQLMP